MRSSITKRKECFYYCVKPSDKIIIAVIFIIKALNMFFSILEIKCEECRAHLRISVWHLSINLKNNHLLKNCWSGPIKNVRILIFSMLYFLKKIKKNTWRYHYFTSAYQKSWWYDLQFLRYRVWQTEIGNYGFPIQGSHVQNHWVAPRSTQSFILPRSIRWAPGISGNLVVKSKLPPQSGSTLESVEPHS